jgi:hypothetical protein
MSDQSIHGTQQGDMAKKKTIGPDRPAEQPAAPTRRRTTTARKPAAAPVDPGLVDFPATPRAEPIDSAADMSVGAGSSDSAAARQPSYEEIAAAAYQRYLDRGGQDGLDFDDWLEAERSLRRGR